VPNSSRLRQIVKTAQFELALRNIIENAREADDFIEAVEWSLARNPRIGQQMTTDDPAVWFLPMIEEQRLKKPLFLLYTFDSERVVFLHIHYALVGEPN